MASGTGWEVVGKGPKKTKGQNQQLTKEQKKVLTENMPRIEVAAPLKESATIYDAFVEKERKRQEKMSGKEQVKPSGDGGNKRSSQIPVSKKKQQNGHRQQAPMTLDEALVKIDKSELELILTKDQATFPENPSVWLKDIASFINLKLENVEEKDPVFADQPKDYPVCKLPKNLRSLLMNTLNQCSNQTLEIFWDHCIQSMVADMGKGLSTFGYRIFIQLMAQSKPAIPLGQLKKNLELMKGNKSRTLRCLSIMWALGQTGHTDFRCGLKVWLELMMPMTGMKTLAGYAVDYLEMLFKNHKDLSSASSVIGFKEFFPVLDLIYSTGTLQAHQQSRLLAIYPKIKTLAFGKTPQNSLRHFFPSFLSRLGGSSSPALKKELLSCLISCLSTDKQCYSVWMQMYTKHLSQSSILLEHILNNWPLVSRSLEKKLLKETIRAFTITNEELAQQGKTSMEGYKNLPVVCKQLLQKMTSSGFPWMLLFLLTFGSLGAVIAFDIYSSGGFEGSRTEGILKNTGILAFSEQVWNRTQLYASKLSQWLSENVPYYWAQLCAVTGPYFSLLWEKIQIFWTFLVDVTRSQREWLQVKIPELLIWVDTKVPWLWTSIKYYSMQAWQLLWWLWELLLSGLITFGKWLHENVFTGSLSIENIQQSISSLLLAIQQYMRQFMQWVMALWTAKTE
ncbi:transmembrane protein 214-B [Lingula anatina]|uniref:Transmembrane protein 214-B n=1 Tax=Lingula anatina TaxID=7574 RepID=A0A1S3IMQ1_LINAN|nr:transmembrane protein 214-B [Lingula anatina]|eukprot:XP_013399368.1 transmembrane protein 214-B [Lingula anatina]